MNLCDIVRKTTGKIRQGIIIGLTLFALNNCNFTIDEMSDWYKIPKSEIPKTLKNTIKEKDGEYFFGWEKNNLIYKEELGYHIVYWVTDKIHPENYAFSFQPARITLKERKGNCARRALVSLALAYKLTDGNEKGELIFCLSNNPDSPGLHYCARINGEINEKYIERIDEVIPFDKIGEYIYYKQ